MSDQTTEPYSSLEAAGTAIGGLLSAKPEEKPDTKEQPEQTKATAPESEQAPAEPSEEEIEQVPSEEGEEQPNDTTSQPRTFKVKVNGQEIEVTEDEVLKGYSRTEDYTRKTQQLAEQRKTFEEQEVAAVRAERNQYATYLEQLKTALKEISPAEPDWQALRTQVSPEQFAAELLNWQQNQKRIEHISGEHAKVKAQQDADAQHGFAKYVQEQQAKLADAIPDMKDPEKSKSIKTNLMEYGKSRGFTEQDLAQVTDHRLVLLLHDAMIGQKAREKAPEIKNKIEKAIEASSPGSRAPAVKTDALKAAQSRLKSTNSVDDAGKAIALYLKKQSA